jgi:hypothetical protein
MRNAVQNALWYVEKKSEQNVQAALEICTDDFVVYSPSFGVDLRGVKENLRGMKRFFSFFPDYKLTPELIATGDGCVILTGRAQMTPDFSRAGLRYSGKKVEVDFSAAFVLRGELLSKETFLLDIVQLCEQSGYALVSVVELFKSLVKTQHELRARRQHRDVRSIT